MNRAVRKFLVKGLKLSSFKVRAVMMVGKLLWWFFKPRLDKQISKGELYKLKEKKKALLDAIEKDPDLDHFSKLKLVDGLWNFKHDRKAKKT